MNRKPQIASSQNEAIARERLAEYVYEYLVHSGAAKAAEAFKSEVPMNNQSVQEPPPGFLHNWWCVFWDLYSAVPDRREKNDPSLEAKFYHDNFFPPSYANMPPGALLNGMHGPPQPWPPNAEGGMAMPPGGYAFPPRGPPQAGPSAQSSQASPIPGYQPNAFPLGSAPARSYAGPGPRSGAPTPSNMAANFAPNQQPGPPPPGAMFPNEQQMRGMAAAQQPRIPPNQMARMPPGAAMRMRPGSFAPGQQPPYFDDHSGTPPFPHNAMMANGCPPGSLMTSPAGMNQMNGPIAPSQQHMTVDGATGHDPRFMVGGVPSHSNAFPPIGHPHSHHGHSEGAGTPNSGGGGPTSVGPNGAGNSHQTPMQPAAPMGVEGQQSQQQLMSVVGGNPLQNILNGGDGGDGSMEVKQSPTTSVHGVNGGTPLGNPPSGHGPSSVHSQSGAGPNSQQHAPHSHQQQSTPTSETAPMEFASTNASSGNGGTGAGGGDEASEILKIKASLTEDFAHTSYHHS